MIKAVINLRNPDGLSSGKTRHDLRSAIVDAGLKDQTFTVGNYGSPPSVMGIAIKCQKLIF